MTEQEIIDLVRALPGVDTVVAGPENNAPEVAWGATFFTVGPPTAMPFATIVVRDMPGFDTASDLGREGVFRVNVSVGRTVFAELFGYPPAAHAEHAEEHDVTAFDRLLPHPLYAAQGWACVLNPGEATSHRLRGLLIEAHERAVTRQGHTRTL
jgi:hypothetical protein